MSPCKLDALCCFDALSDAERDELFSTMTTVKYSKGETIVKQGFALSSILFLDKGIVKLDVASDNQNTTISIVSAKAFVGLMCSFVERQVDFSVVALVDSEVSLIDKNAMDKLIRTNGEFASRMVHLMSLMTKEMVSELTRKNTKNSLGAISLTLLELMKHFGSSRYTLPFTRTELSEVVGFSKESVNLSLASLSKDGLIALSGKHVEILDEERLRSVAQRG